MLIKDAWEGVENGALTWEQFEAKTKEAKFVDVKEGGYVSKAKHDTELQAKDAEITQLNGTITSRDADLANVKAQLQAAGQDVEKLAQVTNDLSLLQSKYDADMLEYKARLSKQARDFAIREYASTRKFTSDAARRDYIYQMGQSEDVKLSKKGTLSGLDEFNADYERDNETAFVKDPEPGGHPAAQGTLPMFIQPTGGQQSAFQNETGKEHFGFSFLPQQPTN